MNSVRTFFIFKSRSGLNIIKSSSFFFVSLRPADKCGPNWLFAIIWPLYDFLNLFWIFLIWLQIQATFLLVLSFIFFLRWLQSKWSSHRWRETDVTFPCWRRQTLTEPVRGYDTIEVTIQLCPPKILSGLFELIKCILLSVFPENKIGFIFQNANVSYLLIKRQIRQRKKVNCYSVYFIWVDQVDEGLSVKMVFELWNIFKKPVTLYLAAMAKLF